MQASSKKIYNCQAMETKTSDDDKYFLLPLLLYYFLPRPLFPNIAALN